MGVFLIVLLHMVVAVAGVSSGQPQNISCVLVFGDSTADPGNNNYLNTTMKANFLPYGVDYQEGLPSGRFSNSRLPADFIAEILGISNSITAFFDLKKLTPEQLKKGVSFASAGSGFDATTGASQNVLPFNKQIEALSLYKNILSILFGTIKAEETLENALVVISSGTSDLIQNYYDVLNQSKKLSAQEYADYLISQLSHYVEEIHACGPKRFVIIELGTLGCLPIVRTLFGEGFCYEPINGAARYFNTKLAQEAAELEKKLDIQIVIDHTYNVMFYGIAAPGKYGFYNVEKGCCGNGTVEYGAACKGNEICTNRKQYLFFDAIHPSDQMYFYITYELRESLVKFNIM